jgi:hypothetical protein
MGVGEAYAVTLGPACNADFNHDGPVDQADFAAFMDAFLARAPRADFNQDGHLNSQDFFDFLAEFFAGC